jgi:N-dimethylarginine dimethylaminohydrolase
MTEMHSAPRRVWPTCDGRHLVLPEQASGLAATIEAAGFEPVSVDLSELLKTGGGPKCCTLEPRH